MAYYLDYRPQKIQDLDLESVRQSLTEILSSKQVPHAFLFVGPKGTGKTSSARILAKAVNCTNQGKSGEPCNRCESCKMIGENQSMDLIEIDAASNRGIDDIRELRDKIKLSPSSLKYKVYIIDEVHMLTNEAFNALLKTLEEPPAHAKFVLCTTEPHKLPGTIVSRCMEVDFVKANTKEIVRSLKKVVKGEKLKIKDDDLVKIAKRSDGSFRDGVKILEQLSATGKAISSKRTREVLERGRGGDSVDKWLLMVYERNSKESLEWLNKAIDGGLSIKHFVVEVVERLRQVLLNNMQVEGFEDLGLEGIDDINLLKELTGLMMRASFEVKGAAIESLPIELAVVEWSEDSSGGGQGEIEVKETQVEVKTKTDIDGGVKKQTVTVREKEVPRKVKKSLGNMKIDEVLSKWKEVLRAMRPHNHSLEALLKATKPTGFEGDFLLLEVFYKFHKERLEVERYKLLVEEVASKVLVAPIKVRYFLSEKTQKVVAKNADDNVSAVVKDDIIKTAEEVFGVEVNS